MLNFFWGIIILDNLTNLLDYFFSNKLKRLGYFISALCVNHLMSIKGVLLMEPNIFHTGVGYLHYAILV